MKQCSEFKTSLVIGINCKVVVLGSLGLARDVECNIMGSTGKVYYYAIIYKKNNEFLIDSCGVGDDKT